MNDSPVCVDANLVIRLVVDPDDEVVRSKWERWDSENRHIAAPTGLHYEFSNPLCRYQRTGMISRAAVRLALIAALSLPAAYDAHSPSAGRLARRGVLDCRPTPRGRHAGWIALGARGGSEQLARHVPSACCYSLTPLFTPKRKANIGAVPGVFRTLTPAG